MKSVAIINPLVAKLNFRREKLLLKYSQRFFRILLTSQIKLV